MANLALIPTDMVPACWPVLKPFIEKILEEDTRNTVDGYYERLCDGRFQIWTAVEDHIVIAAMLTEIVTYDLKKVCRMVGCVGENMKAWVHYIEDVERWAKSVGCDEIEPVARKGWEWMLRPHGYRLTHVVLTKELGDA